MRIVMLLPMGIDRPSGQRYFNIAKCLMADGHSVRLLALHPDLAACRQRKFHADGVDVWYVGQMHALKRGNEPARFGPLHLLYVLLTSTLGMIWAIVQTPADVYHLGKPQPINGVAAIVGVLLLRRQRFYVDCDDDEVAANRLTAGWQRAIFGFWQWVLPKLAAGVTVNTQFLGERMQRAGVSSIEYVPNGVDLTQFRRPAREQLDALREQLNVGDAPIVTYVGTLALHNHPIDLLLDAFVQVAKTCPSTVLLIVGGGEDMPVLARRTRTLGLADRVRFTGHIPREHVHTYLSISSCTVEPVYDNIVARARSPLKVLESMAVGVPVVAGDVGDRARLLQEGRAGVLVPPGDAEALAGGIITLLRDDDRRTAMAQAAQQHVQEYTWSRLAARWQRVYYPTAEENGREKLQQ